VDGRNADTPVGRLGLTKEDVYLVVCSWRELNQNVRVIDKKRNIIILDKDRLQRLYSPTLATRPQFYYYQMLKDIAKMRSEAEHEIRAPGATNKRKQEEDQPSTKQQQQKDRKKQK